MNDPKVIKILGAGPSGLTTAINLAQNDYKVIIYEKNPDVGMRFHGDFQGLENWSSKEDVLTSVKNMSLAVNFYHKPFYSGYFYSLSSSAHVESTEPMFYLIQRGKGAGTLDYSLKAQAIKLGVSIIFNTSLDYADVDIIATGPKRINMMAFGITFVTNLKDIAMVILDNDISPKGYAYLLVSDKKATLATVLFEQFKLGGKYLEKAIEKFKQISELDIINAKKFAGYGGFFLSKSAIREKKIYAGEAAGFQDFLFGFGIRYAITSGYLAAKSIIENVDYNALWRSKFYHQMKTSLSNRAFYELFGNTIYDYLMERTRKSKDPRGL
ncbi:MAG: NAD(P)/FAD-dependent oxidoreductase [Nitrospirae bacterium]|nr:NAD(P)/FAD-dependent oxidoreductase [Nitrospirota bacterium]